MNTTEIFQLSLSLFDDWFIGWQFLVALSTAVLGFVYTKGQSFNTLTINLILAGYFVSAIGNLVAMDQLRLQRHYANQALVASFEVPQNTDNSKPEAVNSNLKKLTEAMAPPQQFRFRSFHIGLFLIVTFAIFLSAKGNRQRLPGRSRQSDQTTLTPVSVRARVIKLGKVK